MKRPTTPKPPGRLAAAARRHARNARPYLLAVAATEVVAVIAVPLLHVNVAVAALLGLGLGLGAAGHHAAERAWEAVDVRRNGGKRAARQRRKYQGTATWLDMHRHLSLRAARRQARFTRPQTPGRLAAREAGVHIGTARRRRLVVTAEESVLLIGKRAGKSAWLSGAIWDAPGAAVVFSTRPDLYTHTAVPRRERGPVWVLNPGGYGNIPSTLCWSPLDGCETAAGAITAAGYLVAAAPQDDNAAFWMQQAHTLLRLFMHAAILGGASIRDVRDWIADPASDGARDALTILDNHPRAATGWGDELAAILLSSDGAESGKSVQSTALSALTWLSDPAMAAAACAPPDEWFDAETFIEDGRGSVYVIGDDRPHNPLTPYFSAFNGHMFETGKRLGGASPGGRLDPPLTLACDEVALNKVPLDRWSAEAGGWGITLLAACQSPSQMEALWGKAGGDTVFDNMTKVVFGGLSVAENLEKLSAACGEQDTWEHVKGDDGKKRRNPAAPRRAVPPERIRTLAKGTALLLHRGVRPIFITVPQVWDRKGYRPATVSPVSAPMVPLDGTVTAPALPGHLTPAAVRGPMNAAAAPTRAVAAPIPATPLEGASDAQR